MNYARSRRVWHDHIVRWGGGANNGVLIRGIVRRPMTMAQLDYKPTERGLFLDKAVRFWISALNVAPINYPDFELDVIVFKGIGYKILMPPMGKAGDGSFVAFDCSCMSTGPV